MAKKKKKPTPPPPPVRRSPSRPASGVAGPSKRNLERAAAAKAASRDALRGRLLAAGLAVAVIAAVAAFVVVDRRGDAELRDALTGGSCTVDDETDPTAAPGSNHVAAPTYAVNPPAGGNHLGTGATRSGVYAGTSLPPDGQLVHALEHGYVIVWHEPELPQPELDKLVAFQEANDGDVIVVERPTLPVPTAATAWGHRLLCQQVEPAALERFAQEYIGQGPEDLPRG